jgi:hypothetical protein
MQSNEQGELLKRVNRRVTWSEKQIYNMNKSLIINYYMRFILMKDLDY